MFGVDYNDKNIGSLGYKSKNFHMSHGMSNKIVDEMNKNGLSEDSIKEFIMMEDRFLELERRAVCSQTSRHFEAVGVSDQIKRRFLGYDFSYHAKHLKQISECIVFLINIFRELTQTYLYDLFCKVCHRL